MEHNGNKIAEIDKKLDNLEKEKVEIFKKQSEGRLQKFETKLNEIVKVLEEKDSKIAALEASLQRIRESLERNILEKDT